MKKLYQKVSIQKMFDLQMIKSTFNTLYSLINSFSTGVIIFFVKEPNDVYDASYLFCCSKLHVFTHMCIFSDSTLINIPIIISTHVVGWKYIHQYTERTYKICGERGFPLFGHTSLDFRNRKFFGRLI